MGAARDAEVLLCNRYVLGMDELTKLLGLGIYTVPETARLTKVSSGRIRRWVRGYAFRTPAGDLHVSPPVWRQPALGDESLTLSFRDLLEVRFVNAFRDRGVSWKVLRRSAEKASKLFGTEHPFSTNRFKTDGIAIFLELVKENREKALLDLAQDQFAFKGILDEFLSGIEFSSKDDPLRWWPLGRKRHVVLDPQRSFGEPIVAVGAVPTRILAAGFRAEDSYDRVARWYGVSLPSVKAAVEYESTLAAAA